MTTPRAMTVNTIVIEVPMLNAAPPLRVSVIVSAPPRSRIFGWSGIVATTMALEMTSAAMTNAATASSSTTRRGRSGGAAFMMRKLICAFRYAGPVPGFEPLPAQVDLPALELQILTRWQDAGIFERSLKQTEGGPSWIFYEGPPTANGLPGAHHVEARTFKDLFPRFKTMQGFHVPRKGGWDCHGLPVEVAVEKELGFTGKGDIEAYGVAEFNARCRESVLRHVDEFEAMTRRLGFWVDADDPYRTMDPEYVQSVWWSLKQVYDKGLLAEDYRVAPYCPRCGTGLSDHELAQGYETVVDPSVYVRFPLTSGPYAGTAALLVWTTTPWTLVSNTAVAVHPEVTYVVATDGGESLVVAEPLWEKVLGDGWEATGQTFTGKEM